MSLFPPSKGYFQNSEHAKLKHLMMNESFPHKLGVIKYPGFLIMLPTSTQEDIAEFHNVH